MGAAHAAHAAGVGLDRRLNGKSTDNKIYDSDQENQSLHHKTTENTEDITSEQNDKTPGHFPQVTPERSAYPIIMSILCRHYLRNYSYSLQIINK